MEAFFAKLLNSRENLEVLTRELYLLPSPSLFREEPIFPDFSSLHFPEPTFQGCLHAATALCAFMTGLGAIFHAVQLIAALGTGVTNFGAYRTDLLAELRIA